MKEITDGQILFIRTYACLHCVLGMIGLMIVIFTSDADISSISLASGSLLTKFGAVLTAYCFAPLLLIKNVGIPLPTIKHLEYLWLIFAGFIYGLIYVFLFKLIKKC